MDIDFYKIAQSYFQGTITDEDEKLLSRFLQEGEQNRSLFQKWEEEWRDVARKQASGKTADAWKRMMERQQKEEMPVKEEVPKLHEVVDQQKASKRRFGYWAAAAVALLLIGSALWLFLPKDSHEPFLAQTAPHEQQTVTLPDGTQVTLNGGSTLTCANDFGKRDRRITFEGEGVFDVQKDAKKPFVIQVGDYSVTVLGTQFNLSAYQQDEAYTLSLMEGSVKIKHKQDSVLVSPNEQVRFDRETATFAREPVQAADADAWTEGRLAFENIPLRDLTRKLERIYDVRISIADAQIANEQVYISISTEESFADVCAALEALLPISIQEQNGIYTIVNQ
jgi:ferric-dicitrate binding protein FerR (iron transport regulator)